jgi:hypothetical protein
MKRISLKESMTGRILDIVFDLDADKIRINGEDVVRKRPLESDEDQFVYGPPTPGPTILYHLTRDQVEQMKKL